MAARPVSVGDLLFFQKALWCKLGNLEVLLRAAARNEQIQKHTLEELAGQQLVHYLLQRLHG